MAVKLPLPISAGKKSLQADAHLCISPHRPRCNSPRARARLGQGCGPVVRLPLSLDHGKRERDFPRPSGQASSWQSCCRPQSSSQPGMTFAEAAVAPAPNYITGLAQRTEEATGRERGAESGAEAALATRRRPSLGLKMNGSRTSVRGS